MTKQQKEDMFNDTAISRGVPFAYIGMQVQLEGKRGIIKGFNSSANLDVVYDNEKCKTNCHPTWEMVYFNKDNTICKDFRESLEG